MEKFGVKYTSICYEKWGTHALFCSRHSHNFSKDETTLYIARATIKMPFKVRFLASGITIEILIWTLAPALGTTDTQWLNPLFFVAQIQIPIPNK